MTREADVVRSLVEMADTLVDDYDVVDLLTGLTDRCVTLLGVSAAGVMLASPSGSLGLVASSSEAMRLLELFELQAQEGPCLDAFRSGVRVDQVDLRAGLGRWPSFSAAAVRAGAKMPTQVDAMIGKPLSAIARSTSWMPAPRPVRIVRIRQPPSRSATVAST